MPAFLTARFVLGVLLGGVGGYLWYRLIGCRTGSCPITSNPWLSTAWGALIGGLVGHG